MNDWFEETLHPGFHLRLGMERVLHETKTEHQHLVIFENPEFGRVLALDGVVQTTERDEFIYHEMLAHVPILAHGSAKNVLIIGGGDGGIGGSSGGSGGGAGSGARTLGSCARRG